MIVCNNIPGNKFQKIFLTYFIVAGENEMTKTKRTYFENSTIIKPTMPDILTRSQDFVSTARAAFSKNMGEEEVISHLSGCDILFYAYKNSKMRYFWRS